jgi:tetratricopeptide (TPR) repeat protein
MEQLKDLTALVAAHGVYALSVIFIFYQQRRAVKNLAEAQEGQDKRYFRMVHASVIAVTYALVTASTVIWFYATFQYQPVKIIKGEVIGLHKLAAAAAAVSVNEQLAPERSDIDFYPVDDVAKLDGEYKFRWALLATEDVRQLAFRFVQRSEAPDATTFHPVPPLGAPASTGPKRRISTLEKRFVLELGTSYSPRHVIQLTYRPDENPSRIGTLWRNHPDGKQVAVGWDESIPLPAAQVQPTESIQGVLLRKFFVTALAAPIVQEVFAADGSYDPALGRALAIQLASADLRTRLFARRILVQAGNRSFRFINDLLDRKVTTQPLDSATLLDSLSSAVDEIELKTPFSDEGQLKLAVSFYDARDYQSAAYRFEKAGNISGTDALNVARRAHAHLEAGSFAKSIQAFNEYLAGNLSKEERLWAYNGLSCAYQRAGRNDEAVMQSREALKIAPDSATTLNTLSYAYAKQGKNLPEALTLVERALKQKPDNSDYLETKGYVLYKLGRVSEGYELIRRADIMQPNHPDTQADLREVQAALARRR